MIQRALKIEATESLQTSSGSHIRSSSSIGAFAHWKALSMALRRRRHGRSPGAFELELDGSVPPEDSATSPSPTPSEKWNDGYGIALNCGYYGECPNDWSERRRRCTTCRVKCCIEICLRDGARHCLHCCQQWPSLHASRQIAPSRRRSRSRVAGASPSTGSLGVSHRAASSDSTLTRSSTESTQAVMCTICNTNPNSYVLVACGHRICEACGERIVREGLLCPFCRRGPSECILLVVD